MKLKAIWHKIKFKQKSFYLKAKTSCKKWIKVFCCIRSEKWQKKSYKGKHFYTAWDEENVKEEKLKLIYFPQIIFGVYEAQSSFRGVN